MPVYQFRCLNKKCKNEFELILHLNQANINYKWCKHCDHLTQWAKVTARNDGLYEEYMNGTNNLKETICCMCHGNSNIPPRRTYKVWPAEPPLISSCPKCKKEAEHIIAVEYRGKDDVSHSSIAFRFNYLAPDV